MQECLKLDPDFEYALNNVGWSLYKQGKYEQALKVFDESIKPGKDGKYPLRNRARALMKLGRFDEAIEAWRAVGAGGKLSRYAKTEIDRLYELIARQKEGQKVSAEEISLFRIS